MLLFSELERVLFVAPHPDDESLGGGGLLQRAFTAGAAVRILFATNGDNNPWAQRFWERRWQIGSGERIRWGRRRQQEALAAIASLGGSSDCARFLDFKDQCITSLLMEGAPELFSVFADEIRAFEPTLLVIPTILDAHPDHSALCVALSLVIDAIGSSGYRVWEYLVHEPQVAVSRRPMALRLSTAEMERKRRAIECHKTQVALSAHRFLRFAKSEESFYRHAAVGVASEARPIFQARLLQGGLNLVIRTLRRERLGAEILLAFRSQVTGIHRRRIRVSTFSGPAEVRDSVSGEHLRDAIAIWDGATLSVVVPIGSIVGIDALFVKLSSWKVFFDRSGWCQVPIARDQTAQRSAKVPNLLTHL